MHLYEVITAPLTMGPAFGLNAVLHTACSDLAEQNWHLIQTQAAIQYTCNDLNTL